MKEEGSRDYLNLVVDDYEVSDYEIGDNEYEFKEVE